MSQQSPAHILLVTYETLRPGFKIMNLFNCFTENKILRARRSHGCEMCR